MTSRSPTTNSMRFLCGRFSTSCNTSFKGTKVGTMAHSPAVMWILTHTRNSRRKDRRGAAEANIWGAPPTFKIPKYAQEPSPPKPDKGDNAPEGKLFMLAGDGESDLDIFGDDEVVEGEDGSGGRGRDCGR